MKMPLPILLTDCCSAPQSDKSYFSYIIRYCKVVSRQSTSRCSSTILSGTKRSDFRLYDCHNAGQYTTLGLLFKTQLNSIGLSVIHKKHITSLLRAQQVNAIYRFVTMVY
jgi:hypothetical protein